MSLFLLTPLPRTQLNTTATASAARTDAMIPSVDKSESELFGDGLGPPPPSCDCPSPEWPLRS